MGVGDTNVWKGAVEDTVALVVGISVVWAVCLKIPLCCYVSQELSAILIRLNETI